MVKAICKCQAFIYSPAESYGAVNMPRPVLSTEVAERSLHGAPTWASVGRAIWWLHGRLVMKGTSNVLSESGGPSEQSESRCYQDKGMSV